VEAIESIEKNRLEQRRPQPLVFPEMIKCVHTLDEIEPFFDGWIRKTAGHDRRAQPLRRCATDLSVMDMSPPMRSPAAGFGTAAWSWPTGRWSPAIRTSPAPAVGSLADRSLPTLERP